MPHPSMIACGLSLPHRARMGLTGLKKYGRKVMKGMGAQKGYAHDCFRNSRPNTNA